MDNKEEDWMNNIRLTPEAIAALDTLFQSAPPHELRANLQEIYHTYLIHAHQTLPIDFEKLAMNMYLLMHCLEKLDQETGRRP
jgi:hypothetical protein